MENKNGHYYVVYSGNNSSAIENALRKRGNWYSVHRQKYLDANFIWRSLSFPNRVYQQVDNVIRYGPPEQILLNHFQFHPIITTKTGLIKSLRYYYTHENNSSNKQVFDAVPTSFIITPDSDALQYKAFQARFSELSKRNFSKEKTGQIHCQHNIWFIKPEKENQGKGIGLTNSIKDIESFLKDKPMNSVWVVQKSIERPLLYYGRKFDIRVWVLVTPHFQIYFYKVPYMRTSNREYEVSNLQTQIHLTNNAQQKKHKDYSKHEQGNTLPLGNLQKYLHNNSEYGNNSHKIMEEITAKMKSLVLDTMFSAKKYFTKSIRKKEFELFGYDFLIDEELKVWLIEVNNNPYLGCPNDFIRNLIPLMIDEMFQIVLDPYFRPAQYTPVEVKNFQLIHKETGNFRINPARYYSSQPKHKTKSIIQNQNDQQPYSGLITMRHKRKIDKLASLASTHKMFEKQLSCSKQLNSSVPRQIKPKYMTPVQALKYLLQNYCYTDIDPFVSPVTLIFNSPKLQVKEPQYLQSNLKTVKMITHSRISHILMETKFLMTCADILITDNYHQELKSLIVQGYEKNAQFHSSRISIMRSIVPSIAKLLQADAIVTQKRLIEKDTRENIGEQSSLSQNLITSIAQLLIKLGGCLERKIFIPGQTRENQLSRQYFIKSNTFSLLLYLKEAYPTICQKQIEEFLGNISNNDWKMHQQYKDCGSIEGMSSSDPTSQLSQSHLKQLKRLSVNINLIMNQKPKVQSRSERHTTEIRGLRTRRQSAFPLIRK